MFSRRRISVALVGLVLLALGGWLVGQFTSDGGEPGGDGSVPGADSGLEVVALADLPPEAEETWELIQKGGPFPYPHRDDTVFGNREQLLPQEPSGYYREYTVETPGSDDRGARRLVAGSEQELYYTNDHYESFVVVDTRT
ncbi:ribonuclease N [Saccharomonospora sp. CUA-673]|uniref:ribonuclease domain-containing protein n=1 Tax=Saccharomonospora sp. CUA-673 TaxID=1904969 RepID=UPI00095E5DC1|nr:ribonuclease domain-containing protein [Saccharomonospora sp. CUA-673]OLT47059.1 ribonuclease N [Saccharomonospora sp. CUA-673]